jgi:replicative DNA helicase
LAILSAEGGIFDIIAGRYSKAVNLDLWLKAHSGDPLKVDRKGRPPEYIRRPTLTLGLMIQPAVLSTIAANREFRGRGFLARILYSYPVSKVGHRRIGAQPVTDEIRHTYCTAVSDLAAGLAGRVGDPAILTLTPTAQTAIKTIEEAVEPTLAGDGELASLADWGAKCVGAVARIAGILHLAEHGAEDGPQEAVNAQTALAAQRIGAYFKACAITAFAEMGTDQATTDAVYLLSRVRHLSQSEVSERDLQRAGKRFKTKAELRPVLDRLVEHGYLTLIQVEESTGGRPASPRYKVTEETKATKGPDRRAA